MVGRDITLDDLKKEGFKSFLISTGFTIGRVLNIEGTRAYILTVNLSSVKTGL